MTGGAISSEPSSAAIAEGEREITRHDIVQAIKRELAKEGRQT